METIYIRQENGILHRCEEHLILKQNGRNVGEIPLIKTKTIVLMTGVQITPHAIDILCEKNIDVIYMSKSGKIKYRISAQSGGGAIIRLAQHNAFMNEKTRLSIAKSITRAKILNQKSLIDRYINHYPSIEYKNAISDILSFQEKLDSAETLNEIMGIEGICAKVYWGCFKTLLKYQGFTRREYRPAPAYVNSALNLGYAFLANEITTQLYIQQFDIEIGFLHSIHYGRNSLTLDIMEEFRSPFVDGWLLGLFNRKILKEEHFKNEKEGFYLTDAGFEKYCALYHEHIEDNNWREKFKTQAENLKKAVMAEGEYSPFIYE